MKMAVQRTLDDFAASQRKLKAEAQFSEDLRHPPSREMRKIRALEERIEELERKLE